MANTKNLTAEEIQQKAQKLYEEYCWYGIALGSNMLSEIEDLKAQYLKLTGEALDLTYMQAA